MSATEILAQKDSYLRVFDATVIQRRAEDRAVALDVTAFYPGGGGQPADHGSLGLAGVVALKREGDVVWHILDTDPPPVGERVHGVVEWERRYALMRTHTAFHILCGVVWRDWKAQVTGGNMEPLRGRMDFEFETLHHDLVHEIERKVNAEVAAAREVRVAFHTREEAFGIPDLIRTKINLLPPGIQVVRTIQIVGLDLQADGGTHVANTREVGTIRVAGYHSKGRINKRIELVVEPAPTP